jgi:hypothetical protein
MRSSIGRTVALGAVVAVAALNTGCWELAALHALSSRDDGSDPAAADWGDPAYGGGTVDVRAHALRGSLGPVEGFEGGIWLSSGVQYGDVATLEVQSRDRDAGWAVMTALDVEGGLDHPDLVPGAELTFRAEDGWASDRGTLFVSLLGCSGPQSGVWDWDVRADEVTVVVSEGETPDRRRIDYTGTWSDGSTVEGSVEYEWN